MKKIFFSILLFMIFYSSSAQFVGPGGVSNISSWYVSEQFPDGRYGWKGVHQNEYSSPVNSGTTLNSHNSSYFDGSSHTFSLPFQAGNGASFTVFIVYRQQLGSGEHCVWSVGSGSNPSLIMTTQRLASLDQYGYINYNNGVESEYRIFTYTHHAPPVSEEEFVGELHFNIGKLPSGLSVPAQHFKGYIPEIILYEHVLNWQDRQRVESYLALKYGISLSQVYPTSYLNSSGGVIWDASAASLFRHNIAGLVRDDNSGLYQTVSTSSREPGLLQMSLFREDDFSDGDFLIWSDNGGDLLFSSQQGQWKQSGRKWQIVGSSHSVDLRVLPEFDLGYFSNRSLAAGEHYALMIDHVGRGTFPIGDVSFVSGRFDKGKLIFPAIDWGSVVGSVDESEVFALSIVPEFFARFEIQAPSCGHSNGVLELEINGGVPPYSVQFQDAANALASISLTTSTRLCTLSDISEGNHRLLIKDANGMVFSESVRVESEEVRALSLASDYTLTKGERLSLTAPEQGVGYYEWLLPDGSISYSAGIDIDQTGEYYLSYRNESGCSSSKRINITSVDSAFSRLVLHPNPSPDGKFTLDIGLHKRDDVFLRIYTVGGVLVSSTKLSGSDYYLYNGSLPSGGSYVIKIVSNQSSEEMKLISL